ncbi:MULTISPECIES: phosphate ABC transporter permease PstA [Vibrio]|uniref:Phosphate transport system permease protein PstA n=1 Tax=Vibrio casei TaxID=673372 RepID=A0A368LIN5_9VIBR|nr:MULTISPECIES: phosphate ABC transporter permease PstA [Vibrio]RCS70567.1 phosphate ABC transporter permease PtsA [Vibrio casei]SJN27526.1 Phosphate transport system permease protein PstA (TC 3.A.1.7.1) [Vibrio casei]HBV77831.1 phosphate ABC transporter permease PtsA [Vibrio sp.]
MTRSQWRTVKSKCFRGLCYGATGLGLLILSIIVYSLLSKGLRGLNLSTFTESMPSPGGEGGLANAIVGSLMISIVGIAIAIPIGLLAGTWLSEYGKNSKLADTIRFLNGMLMSSPSILIGLFIYEICVKPAGSFSGWAGSFALAVIALPMIISTTEEMLKLVPKSIREAGAGLGLPKWRVTLSLSYRSVGAGILTGVLLSFARISGETAPLLFTALNNTFMSLDMNGPMANLPVTIYRLAMSPYDSWNDLAWTGALIITVAILLLNVASRVLPTMLAKYAQLKHQKKQG